MNAGAKTPPPTVDDAVPAGADTLREETRRTLPATVLGGPVVETDLVAALAAGRSDAGAALIPPAAGVGVGSSTRS